MEEKKMVSIGGREMCLLPADVTFPTKARIGCQGVRGAYSEQAAKRMFPLAGRMFFKTFGGVIEAVKSGLCDYGILPIENNSFGSVRAVYQLLKSAGVYIIRSERILIRHQLLVKPGTSFEEVTSIRSHEQAIGQCSRFLKTVEGKIPVIPVLNTAMAARYAAETDEKGAAAIASPEAAEAYGLVTLANRVSDSDNNYTRFVCISREPLIYAGANRISMILTVSHTPGSLYRLLGEFAGCEVNVLKLESSPLVGRDFEFCFYIDAEASCADPEIRKMLERIKASCPDFIFLGNYSEV
ncbi:MAG: bifunctional chorismate mutase/prephenate dehydratase [Lachnospiraceae bacterium]|nr:bifunctional chorismate mutase/prephenate dehydratase [Lachnospiraceae bacterium]